MEPQAPTWTYQASGNASTTRDAHDIGVAVMTRRRVPTLAHETFWSLLNEAAALVAALRPEAIEQDEPR
jgi:hypothetical protein